MHFTFIADKDELNKLSCETKAFIHNGDFTVTPIISPVTWVIHEGIVYRFGNCLTSNGTRGYVVVRMDK